MANRQVLVGLMLLACASMLVHGEETNPAYGQDEEQDQQQLEVQRLGGQLVVTDWQCDNSSLNVQDIDVDLAFGSEDIEEDKPLATFFFVRSLENNGLANTSNPICASAAVGLLTPCTSVFNVTWYANDTYIIKPSVNAFVSADCEVSHCQGAVGQLVSDGRIEGTFYARGADLTPTFQFSVRMAMGDTAITVVVPGEDFTCTLLYDEDGYHPDESWLMVGNDESLTSESYGI